MPFRKFGGKRRRPVARMGRKTVRTAKLVNGKSPFTAMEQVYNAGGNAIPHLIRGYKQIRGLINVEPKFVLNSTIDNTAISTTATLQCLNLIAQGADEQQRNGNRILAKDLYIRYEARQHASATLTHLRMIIFVDKENRGADPAVTDVLESSGIVTHHNVDNTRRFVTLMDKVFSMSDTGNSAIIFGKKLFKLPFHMDYSLTTGVIGAVKENAVFVMLLSNEATNTPSVSFHSKLTFYDN